MSLPSDHADAAAYAAAEGRQLVNADGSTADPSGGGAGGKGGGAVTGPKLGALGWLRWIWRQLSSMRVALFLLLMLALAAIPGSLVPQRSSDPNGVTQYFVDNKDLAPVLDSMQFFDVYTSAWFSSIYLLLFISLVGCIIPRTKHHWEALRTAPPRTPARLSRLVGFTTRDVPDDVSDELAVEQARAQLRRQGYRAVVQDASTGNRGSVSAERGYIRETGNLIFHTALVGVLVTVGIGGGFGYAGQRVIVEGQSFVNTLLAFDSFNPGRFFSEDQLTPFKLTLDEFSTEYETKNLQAYGQPIDYTASVTTQLDGATEQNEIKVNHPLRVAGSDIFLLGNGYAPTITVRDAEGTIVFTDSVPFLPQSAELTSLGIVKIPDGLPEQLGMIGFFYPTQAEGDTGAYFSSFPGLEYPVLTLNVWQGSLGLDEGVPTSVYSLNTDGMEQLTGGETGVESIELKPGEQAKLPNGMGTVTFDNVKRFASFDVHHDPSAGWVLLFAILVVAGLLTSLFVPRRRMWVKLVTDADGVRSLEYAGLARGDDPRLIHAVEDFANKHRANLR